MIEQIKKLQLHAWVAPPSMNSG